MVGHGRTLRHSGTRHPKGHPQQLHEPESVTHSTSALTSQVTLMKRMHRKCGRRVGTRKCVSSSARAKTIKGTHIRKTVFCVAMPARNTKHKDIFTAVTTRGHSKSTCQTHACRSISVKNTKKTRTKYCA